MTESLAGMVPLQIAVAFFWLLNGVAAWALFCLSHGEPEWQPRWRLLPIAVLGVAAYPIAFWWMWTHPDA